MLPFLRSKCVLELHRLAFLSFFYFLLPLLPLLFLSYYFDPFVIEQGITTKLKLLSLSQFDAEKKRLQVQLVSKLREVNENPALSKQFYKAIALCDAFLHSCDNTERGLENLKRQVKDVIAASVRRRVRKVDTPKAPAQKDDKLSSRGEKNDKPSLWTLPVHRIELLAKQNTDNEYGVIAVQADEAAMQEVSLSLSLTNLSLSLTKKPTLAMEFGNETRTFASNWLANSISSVFSSSSSFSFLLSSETC